MICKPTSWEEADEDFVKTDDLTPRLSMLDLGIRNLPDVFGAINVPHRFILRYNGKEYAVETQGHDYIRYIHRIK